MEKILLITEEELDKKINDALDRFITPVMNMLKESKPPEEPMKRSEIMAELQIKDLRTFNKRVVECHAKSCGIIGKEPVYYKSQFLKPTG